jgi:hypothetical protein
MTIGGFFYKDVVPPGQVFNPTGREQWLALVDFDPIPLPRWGNIFVATVPTNACRPGGTVFSPFTLKTKSP